MIRKPRTPIPKVTAADKAIGKRIEQCRKRQKVSQQALGKAIGVTHQQIQKYERGQNRLVSSRLKDIADYLGVPATYFLGEAIIEDEVLNKAWNALPNGQIREQFIALMTAVGRLA